MIASIAKGERFGLRVGFQFHYGMIASGGVVAAGLLGAGFQFHYGMIARILCH